ncbi:MAG: arsenate reductase family protein [Defluviitaleaceae bacterium]|nr:arsenate reductase family protein [Defluviitaleaceae bacterium]
MNIQIFGKSKCFDTKKAERWFKERKIKYQLVDLPRFGLSRGEYQGVRAAVGGIEKLIDTKSKEYEKNYIEYTSDADEIETRLLDNPGMFVTPIVRNGKKATVGFAPEVWLEWV